MRAPTNLSRGKVGFNMTPMIDVVFLLIIFFLVSSHLAQQEVQLELDLPVAASGQRPEKAAVRRVVVNILPHESDSAQLSVSGQAMDQEELARRIDFESRANAGQLEVRIRCDRRVPYRMVEPVMVACAKAGVWKVSFAVVGSH